MHRLNVCEGDATLLRMLRSTVERNGGMPYPRRAPDIGKSLQQRELEK